MAASTEVVVLEQLLGDQDSGCMNQQEALLTEIQNLRTDLAAQSVRVLALESRSPSVAASREAFSTPSRSPLVINYSGNSSPAPCNYVGGSSPVPLPPFPQQGPAEAATSGTLTSSATTSARVSDTAQLAATRIEAAEEAGRFIQRSLAGDHRGTSGRERVPFASRYYICFKDYLGNTYSPAQVHRSWGSIKPLVKPNNQCGDSVFIGWPTLQEAKICCETAGVRWPADA